MDLEGISTLLTRDGWALLESLPPYDEATAMALGERLRREGHSPALVSAAMTQSRLRDAGCCRPGARLARAGDGARTLALRLTEC